MGVPLNCFRIVDRVQQVIDIFFENSFRGMSATIVQSVRSWSLKDWATNLYKQVLSILLWQLSSLLNLLKFKSYPLNL